MCPLRSADNIRFLGTVPPPWIRSCNVPPGIFTANYLWPKDYHLSPAVYADTG